MKGPPNLPSAHSDRNYERIIDFIPYMWDARATCSPVQTHRSRADT